MKKTSNELIEMIMVRVNSVSDPRVVQEILSDMSEAFSQPEYQLRSVRLCKSEQVANDWAIYLLHPSPEGGGKSELAISLAEMLRTVGLVHHTVWKPCDTQSINDLLPVPTKKAERKLSILNAQNYANNHQSLGCD